MHSPLRPDFTRSGSELPPASYRTYGKQVSIHVMLSNQRVGHSNYCTKHKYFRAKINIMIPRQNTTHNSLHRTPEAPDVESDITLSGSKQIITVETHYTVWSNRRSKIGKDLPA